MKHNALRAVWLALDALARALAWFALRAARVADAAEIEMLIALADQRIKAQQRQANKAGES